MWEITLCGKYDDVVYLVDLEKILKDRYKSDVITAIWICDDVIFNIATNNQKIVENIKKIILELLIKIAKTKFFKDNLHIFINDTSINTFLISSLTMIDLEEEMEEEFVQFDINNYINIHSYILFKFRDLRLHWQYLADYINYSFLNSSGDGVYLEFLKFLTNLQSPKYEALYVEKNNKYLEIFNVCHEKIKSLPDNDEIGVIVNLIMLSPKKIIVNCLDNLSTKTSNLLNFIFEEKLTYLL